MAGDFLTRIVFARVDARYAVTCSLNGEEITLDGFETLEGLFATLADRAGKALKAKAPTAPRPDDETIQDPRSWIS